MAPDEQKPSDSQQQPVPTQEPQTVAPQEPQATPQPQATTTTTPEPTSTPPVPEMSPIGSPDLTVATPVAPSVPTDQQVVAPQSPTPASTTNPTIIPQPNPTTAPAGVQPQQPVPSPAQPMPMMNPMQSSNLASTFKNKRITGAAVTGLSVAILAFIGYLFFMSQSGTTIGALKTVEDGPFSYKVPEQWETVSEESVTGYHPTKAVAKENGEDKYDIVIAHTSLPTGVVISDYPKEAQDLFIPEFKQRLKSGEEVGVNDLAGEICDENIKTEPGTEITVNGTIVAYEYTFTCDLVAQDSNKTKAQGNVKLLLPENHDRMDVFMVGAHEKAYAKNKDKLDEIAGSLSYK